MSTCSTKCAPPFKSKPSAIGSPPSACSQSGVVEARFSATTYCRSSPAGFRRERRMVLPRSWSSLLARRSSPPSGTSSVLSTTMPAAPSAASSSPSSSSSTGRSALSTVTCSAKSGVKRLGAANRKPSPATSASRTNRHGEVRPGDPPRGRAALKTENPGMPRPVSTLPLLPLIQGPKQAPGVPCGACAWERMSMGRHRPALIAGAAAQDQTWVQDSQPSATARAKCANVPPSTAIRNCPISRW